MGCFETVDARASIALLLNVAGRKFQFDSYTVFKYYTTVCESWHALSFSVIFSLRV